MNVVKLLRWLVVAYYAAAWGSLVAKTMLIQRVAEEQEEDEGFTAIEPSVDSRIIYVSSSDGNNADDGLSEANAKLTIAAGMALMRNGSPDHILLKRGDTFTDQSFGTYNNDVPTGGRSAAEPWLFGAYGSGDRPIIQTDPDGSGLVGIGHSFQYLAIIGIHFEPLERDPEVDVPNGLFFIGTAGNPSYLLVEDCYFNGFGGALSVRGIDDVRIRRNIIINSWNLDAVSHSQGMYADEIDGLLIEENFLDHNGWHDTVVGAEATAFNHNLYLTHGLINTTIRGNISSRGSSMGIKFQPVDGDHTIENNLFVRCGYLAQIGGGKADDQVGQPGATIYCNDNVFCEGDDLGATKGLGVTVSNVKAGTFNNNLLVHRVSTQNGGSTFGLSLQDGLNAWETTGDGVNDFQIENFIAYDYRAAVQVLEPEQAGPTISNVDFINMIHQEPDAAFTLFLTDVYSASGSVNSFTGGKYYKAGTGNPFDINGTSRTYAQWVTDTGETGSSNAAVSFVDSTRTATTYAVSQGYTDWEDFVDAASSRAAGDWPEELTAEAANEWIRAGFVEVP